jgi:hypothetical protein
MQPVNFLCKKTVENSGAIQPFRGYTYCCVEESIGIALQQEQH